MALSGSTDFTLTAYELARLALRKTGIEKGDPAQIKRVHLDAILDDLNLILKSWRNRAGLQLWKMTEIYVALDKNRTRYDLGSSATNIFTFKKRTHTLSLYSSGDTSIVVAGTTADFANQDPIEIRLDNDQAHVTAISGSASPSGAGVSFSLLVALPADVNVGAQVDTYKRDYRVPLRVTEVVRMRDIYATQTRTPIRIVSREEYFAQSSQLASGSANLVWFDNNRDTPALHIHQPTDDLDSHIRLQVQMPLDDIDDKSNNIDIRQSDLNALVYALAAQYADGNDLVSVEKQDRLHMRAEKLMLEAEQADDEFDTSLYFVPDSR